MRCCWSKGMLSKSRPLLSKLPASGKKDFVMSIHLYSRGRRADSVALDTTRSRTIYDAWKLMSSYPSCLSSAQWCLLFIKRPMWFSLVPGCRSGWKQCWPTLLATMSREVCSAGTSSFRVVITIKGVDPTFRHAHNSNSGLSGLPAVACFVLWNCVLYCEIR